MAEPQESLLNEAALYFEQIDAQMARVQAQAYQARRYAMLCDDHFAQLDAHRRELEALMSEWSDINNRYSAERRLGDAPTFALPR